LILVILYRSPVPALQVLVAVVLRLCWWTRQVMVEY
jgi:hypothetical protein